MTKGQRRPQADDMEELMVEISGGKSLSATCRMMGLHVPTTHEFINADDDLRERYARARELRAEVFAEEALIVTKAAALGKSFDGSRVEPNGARVYLDAIKWAAGRMAPKSGPIQRVSFEGVTARDRIAGRIAGAIARNGTKSDPVEPD